VSRRRFAGAAAIAAAVVETRRFLDADHREA